MELHRYRKEIGALVRKFREEAGLTLQELINKEREDYALVSENTLLDLEKGKKIPKQEILDAILNALGITMQDLLLEVKKGKFAT